MSHRRPPRRRAHRESWSRARGIIPPRFDARNAFAWAEALVRAPHVAGQVRRILRASTLAGDPAAASALVEWAVSKLLAQLDGKPTRAIEAALRRGAWAGVHHLLLDDPAALELADQVEVHTHRPRRGGPRR